MTQTVESLHDCAGDNDKILEEKMRIDRVTSMMNSPVNTGLARVPSIALSLATATASYASGWAADQHVANAIFGETFAAENVLAVSGRAPLLELNDRYQFPIGWVLPSETHSTIRMQGNPNINDDLDSITGQR